MNTKALLGLGAAGVLLLALAFVTLSGAPKGSPAAAPQPVEQQEPVAIPSSHEEQPSSVQHPQPQSTHVTMIVGSQRYVIDSSATSTVLAIMQRAKSSESGFSYTSKDYPSLGVFVDSINGTSQSDNKYWMFYVNGVQSPVGISHAQVHPGDTIEWKLE